MMMFDLSGSSLALGVRWLKTQNLILNVGVSAGNNMQIWTLKERVCSDELCEKPVEELMDGVVELSYVSTGAEDVVN